MALETALLHDQHLVEDKTLPDIQPVHKTICRRCGRALTNPISVARGIGPKCARTVTYETRRSRETPSYSYTTRTLHYFLAIDQLENDILPKDHQVTRFQIKNSSTSVSKPESYTSSSKLIPECSSCHRSLVYGRRAEKLSKQQDRDIFYCNNCVAVTKQSMAIMASQTTFGK